MELMFSNNDNKQKAIEILQNNSTSLLLPEDAIMLLLKGIKKEDLSNLCNTLSHLLNISTDEAYDITQSDISKEKKIIIYNSCLMLVNNNVYLGSNVINNSINTSSWLSHSINSAILSSRLANLIGIDSNYAFSYGLLHDYGRKYDHDFSHVIKGFEELIKLGYSDIAKGCLTHSFINAGRNCNNEVVNDSFFIDNNGKERYNEKDDMDEVLASSNYSIYDYILNIVDLMATDRGITTPKERIDDIATRRPGIDNSPNRKYFYVSFYNLLVSYLNILNIHYDLVDYNEVTLDEIKNRFNVISKEIYELQNNENNNKRGL